MKNGSLYIISAPSGTGKTTILKRVISELENVVFSVSHTTRAPRAGEKDGVDYFFVSEDSFRAMQQQGHFLEWAEVHGNFYGTSSYALKEIIEQGKDIILDIDVQGALQMKDKVGEKGFFVFISPPSLQELEKRLVSRGTESATVVATRLKNAQGELNSIEHYDYVIVNDQLDLAVEELKAIIAAERSKKNQSVPGEHPNLNF